MNKLVPIFAVPALALLSTTGCAVQSGDGAEDDVNSTTQAYNNDYCATGTDANDTENITVAGQRATYARGPGWMNGNSLCPDPRKTTIVDFNVNSANNLYEYEFFSNPDFGTIPPPDCEDTWVFTRVQYEDRQTHAWVQTDYQEKHGVLKMRFQNGAPEIYCQAPSYAGHFSNLRSSASATSSRPSSACGATGRRRAATTR